jgi:hypothetical protein
MLIVPEPEPELARLRPLFMLEKLSFKLRSDVLEDGSISSTCGFTAKRQVQATDEIVIDRDELFAALRNASKVPVTCRFHGPNDALVDATITINEDGSATLEIAGKQIRFPWVALLSSDADERLAQLDKFLHRYPLSDGDAASLRNLVYRPDYSDGDFWEAAKLFESSPETFVERVTEKVQRHENRMAPVDVLPGDDRYWNHLLPAVAGSMTLADYSDQELSAAWRDGLEADPFRALYRWALTFAAAELVPHSRLQGLNTEVTAGAIETVLEVEDPLSLVGAFEICAGRAAQDQRFVILGDRLLDSLFADMQRLTRACALFGAIFVITTAHLATHETLQRRPVFWRRLAAAAHASLIVRALGGNGIDPDRIISWALRLFGDAYYLSVVSDFAIEPQWRPEWILPKILVADLFGRAVGALGQLPQEAAPLSWKERLDKANAWIVTAGVGAFPGYPSVLQGSRRLRPKLAELQTFPHVADAFLTFANDPTLNALLSIWPLIETFGFPDESLSDVEKVVASIRSAPPNEIDETTLLALSILAHIGLLTENASLADGVSELCLEGARRVQTHRSIFGLVCRLIECTAVVKDRAEAARTLARRLEILAFIVPSSEAAEGLASDLETLKRIRPDLAPLLGRALSAARLGSPRAIA